MSVTAGGPLADAIAGVIALLSNSPYFQTWTGTGSAAAAAGRIFATEAGFPIASISFAGEVAAITTRDKHNLAQGGTVSISGASLGPQTATNVDGGSYTVASVIGTTAFTINVSFAGTETLYPDFAFVVPCARPFAVVCIPDGGSLQSEQNATGGGMVQSGKLEIQFEANTSAGYANDPVNAPAEANTALGLIVASMQATNDTGVATFTDASSSTLEFVANTIQFSIPPAFTAKDEQDDNTARFERWRALIEVTWGLAG